MITKDDAKKLNVKVIENTLDEKTKLTELLKQNFPSTFKDGALDQEAIAMILGVSQKISGYELTWTGKALANALYQTPAIKELSLQSGEINSPNSIIIGDNLDALKILSSAYYEKIKMIYIDPPYNTESDGFIYKDNYREDYKDILRKLNLLYINEDGKEVESDSLNFIKNIQSTKSHSGWLSFMLPRLKLARDLLKEDGVIFISIDDREQANLKLLCDEIFGEENFVANLCVELSTTQGMKVASAQKGQIVKNAEYILCYAKDTANIKFERPLYTAKEWDDHYSVYIDPESIKNGKPKRDTIINFLKNKYPNITQKKIAEFYADNMDFRKYIHDNAENIFQDSNCFIEFDFTDDEKQKLDNREIIFYKKYMIFKTSNGTIKQEVSLAKAIGDTDDFEAKFGLRKIRGDWWAGYYKDMMNINKEGDVIFKNGKKPIRLIKDLLKISTTPNSNDIILDFFAGSATTAHAVMEQNLEDGGDRKFILVQLDESIDQDKSKVAYDFCKNELHSTNPVISDITVERVKRAALKLKSDMKFNIYTMPLKEGPTIKDSHITLPLSTLSSCDIARNMLLSYGKGLDATIKELIKGQLFICDELLVIIKSDKSVIEKIKEYKNSEVILNGYDDIGFDDFKNLEVIAGERLRVAF